jgi:hypothetical protein
MPIDTEFIDSDPEKTIDSTNARRPIAGAGIPSRVAAGPESGSRRRDGHRIGGPEPGNSKSEPSKGLRIAAPPVAHRVPTDTCQTDPDLATVITAWDRLPEAVRAGIAAMVKAASQ